MEIVVCLLILGLCGLLSLPGKLASQIRAENRQNALKKAQKAAEEREVEKKKRIRELLSNYNDTVEEIADLKAEIKYMTDESRIMYAQRYLNQLQEAKNQIREEISDELLED